MESKRTPLTPEDEKHLKKRTGSNSSFESPPQQTKGAADRAPAGRTLRSPGSVKGERNRSPFFAKETSPRFLLAQPKDPWNGDRGRTPPLLPGMEPFHPMRHPIHASAFFVVTRLTSAREHPFTRATSSATRRTIEGSAGRPFS